MTYAKSATAILLGFDYGRKRIGVAVGQQLTQSATPLMTLQARNGEPDWAIITSVIKEWNPEALVVGIPYHMDGTKQDMSKWALRFCRQLEGRYHLPVYKAEERLTSYQAESGMNMKSRKREDTDPLAAQIILQDWLQKDNAK
ncbi:MAG: Holliday junction resolvase RuvX [Thiogranum sp.]|nr:Holliday junction resolvase RuvX [Thiogranum sp.]